jgi:hypothetical protein
VAGTRVRLTHLSPWPERVGCVGTVVGPTADRIYPQPTRWECIVQLDADPLGEPHRNSHGEMWSCVVGWKGLDFP